MSITHATLEQLQPLPIRGRSWPKAIAIVAWLLLAIIGARLAYLASTYGDQIALPIMGSVLLAYTGMLVIAYYMWTGHTTITAEGIKQDWILKRELAWTELRYAKFIPLFYSKRLLCFTHRGRPVVFQGASTELQVAFAKISLARDEKSQV